MKRFDKKDLIDLDECVFNALKLFVDRSLPELVLSRWQQPLVVGCGNADVARRILFDDEGAAIAAGYFISLIRKQHPDYFNDNIVQCVRAASRSFGEKIEVIV